MIPLEDFFKKPDKIMLRLSPDGHHLAWMEPWQRRLNVVVRDLQGEETRRVTAATERDITAYVWANNEDCDDGNQDNDDACVDSCTSAACGDVVRSRRLPVRA